MLTIDNRSALERKPSIEELLQKAQLTNYVRPIYAHTSYNWELMKLVDKHTKNGRCEPIFDFCYLDGSHNFEIDTCAFFKLISYLSQAGLFYLMT